jgi:hypothetical protein
MHVYIVYRRLEFWLLNPEKTAPQKIAFLRLRLGTLFYTRAILPCVQTMDHQPKWKQMTTAACQGAFIFLHSLLNEGELERGAMAQAERLFGVSHKAVAPFRRKMNKKI